MQVTEKMAARGLKSFRLLVQNRLSQLSLPVTSKPLYLRGLDTFHSGLIKINIHDLSLFANLKEYIEFIVRTSIYHMCK